MGEEATLSRVFVGKLAQRTTAEDIETAFGDYGTVVKVEKKENLTGSFAFVFYNESSHAQAAIAAMNGKELHGNEIVVEAARGRVPQSGSGSGVVSSTKGIKELRISCTGLDDRTSWQDLKDWARAAGNVTFANTFNKDGQLIGVIEYESVNDVTNALDTLETVPCRGANLKLFKDDLSGGLTAGSGGGGRGRYNNNNGGGYRDRDRDLRGGGYGGGGRDYGGYRGGGGGGGGYDRGNYDRGYDNARSYDYARGGGGGGGGDYGRGGYDAPPPRYGDAGRYSDGAYRGGGGGGGGGYGGHGGYQGGGGAGGGTYYPRDDRARSRSRSRGRAGGGAEPYRGGGGGGHGYDYGGPPPGRGGYDRR